MKKPSTVSVSVRLSLADRVSILSEAEKQNINVSELLRKSWKVYQSSAAIKNQLLEMEHRLTKNMVEIVFSGHNLNNQERETCINDLNSNGVKW